MIIIRFGLTGYCDWDTAVIRPENMNEFPVVRHLWPIDHDYSTIL